MKPHASLALTLLLALPAAAAQTTDQTLDLSLPVSTAPLFAENTAPVDPPGTYYGDTSGKPGNTRHTNPGAPAASDDGSAQVWGSVSTGVGYSKDYGTSWGHSANLNVSKAFGENNQNRAALSIDVSKSEGPGFYSRYPHDTGWDLPRGSMQRSGINFESDQP